MIDKEILKKAILNLFSKENLIKAMKLKSLTGNDIDYKSQVMINYEYKRLIQEMEKKNITKENYLFSDFRKGEKVIVDMETISQDVVGIISDGIVQPNGLEMVSVDLLYAVDRKEKWVGEPFPFQKVAVPYESLRKFQ